MEMMSELFGDNAEYAAVIEPLKQILPLWFEQLFTQIGTQVWHDTRPALDAMEGTGLTWDTVHEGMAGMENLAWS